MKNSSRRTASCGLGFPAPTGVCRDPAGSIPYGRGADRGICGLDRDGMVAAFLLRLSLQGVLETMQPVIRPDHTSDEISWPAPLDKKAAAALEKFGGAPLSTREIFESAVLLARPSATPEALVRQAVRLGILGIGLAEQRGKDHSSGSMGCRVGYGLLAGEAILVGVSGRIPEALIEALLKETAGTEKSGSASDFPRGLDPRRRGLPSDRLHLRRGGDGSQLPAR